MDDFNVETCVICNTEKGFEDFNNEYSECKTCNIKRVLKRYYKNKNEILQKRRDKNARYKYLDNSLKTLEEKLSVFNLIT